jgi:hypothetical protein
MQKRLEKYWRILDTTDGGVFRVAASIRPGTVIGEFEAYVLASAYFDAYISGCGGAELPKERGDLWIAESAEGYAGAPGPRIIVEKKTGLTYSPGRRKVRDPKEYLKFIRKTSNQTIQPTADRSAFWLSTTSTRHQQRRAPSPAVADLVSR